MTIHTLEIRVIIKVDDKEWDIDAIIEESKTRKDLRQFDRMDATMLSVNRV